MAGKPLIVIALLVAAQLPRVTGHVSAEDTAEPSCDSSTESHVYRGFEGEIRSPGYDGVKMYPPNQNCHWRIDTNRTSVPWMGIRLWFEHYDLADCVGDNVKIIELIGAPMNNTKCGEMGTYESDQTSLNVDFISDGQGSGHGFILKYRGFCKYNPAAAAANMGNEASVNATDSCTWTVSPAGESQGLFIDVQPRDNNPSSWKLLDSADGVDTALTGHSHWIQHDVNLTFQPASTSGEFNTNSTLTVASFDKTHPCFANNPCGSNNCLPDEGHPDSYRCDPDVCNNYACNHDGTCYVTVGGVAECLCADGYIGEHCMSFADPCASHDCVNGHCIVNNSTPICTCDTGFKGEYCNESDICASYPCRNGGTCSEDPETAEPFICNCPGNYTENDCSVRDYCQSNPCIHGNCTNSLNGYNCTCTEGYFGDTCSDFDYCSGNPCRHNGQCSNEAAQYSCTCPSEFRGDDCSEPNDSRHCWSGVDTYQGSGIVWGSTALWARDSQPCPGALGNATRPCLANNVTNPPIAYWGQPDLSGCVSERLVNIFNAVQTLLEAEVVEAEAVVNISASLAAAVSQNSSDGVTRLYAGDLGMATTTVAKVADVVAKTRVNENDIGFIAKSYGEAVSNVVDPSTGGVWRYTQSGYLETRMTSLLHSMELLSINLADKTSEILVKRRKRKRNVQTGDVHATINVTTSNLDFQVRMLHRGKNMSRLELHGETGSLSLPGEVYRKAVISTSDPYIHLYQARFTSFSGLLAETHGAINTHSGVMSSRVLNSDILATRVLNVPEDVFQSLTDAVKLQFRLQNTSLSQRLEQNCIFLNMSATSAAHRWLKQGCVRSVAESNASYTVCYCNHMTNFAVLMDVYDIGDDIDDVNTKILTYLSYGGGGLSILGCVVSIIVFQFFRLSSERIRIHEHLALSIMLVQVFFLVGIDRTENKAVCKAMAICMHYSLVAMFCWMLVEGSHLYLVLVKVFNSRSHLKKYMAIGWGIPLVVVGISAGIFHDDYGSGSICWLTQKVLLVAFAPAVGLVIVINSVVLLIVMKTMLNSMSKGSKISVHDRSSVRVGLKAAAVLLPLLGLTWTFGFLSINDKGTLIFTYLFTIFNSLQGVFFFVFHCLLSVDVQKAYERRNKRKSQLRLTESSFSVRERKRSDSYSSSCGKQSIRTVMTDTMPATLERRRSAVSGHYDNEVVRPQSVTFDDDVFLPNSPSRQQSLHNRSAGSFHTVINTMPDVVDNRGIFNNGPVFNEIRRRSASETNGYLFYYGKGSKNSNGGSYVTGIDKNDLYATVNK